MDCKTSNIPEWAAALGRVPSGLFIVTIVAKQRATGMLVSWVQQCSFDPPQLTLAVRKGRHVLDWLANGAAFVVNVIPEGEKKLVAHFGKGFEPGDDAFEGLAVEHLSGSALVLSGAHAYIDCRVAGRCETGDHVLVIGEVVGGRVLSQARPATHVRRNGLNY